MWHKSILELIGQTPMLELSRVTAGISATVLVKIEYFNPGNSIKDRIGLKMIEAAELSGQLKPGGTVIESTSGNTGMGVALVAAMKGYKCICTMKDSLSKEKINSLRSLGAKVVLCPSSVPTEHPDSYKSVAIRLAKETPNSFHLNQYENPNNPLAHYEGLGPEIWEQTEHRITHYVATLGTCGTLCGVARYLKEQNPAIKAIGVDVPGSILKKYKETGEVDRSVVKPILTEGVGRDYIPGNLDIDLVDEIIHVSDTDGARMARTLAEKEGLFVGWSSGTAVCGALNYARNLPKESIVVVVLPDHGSRYLGKIYNDDWLKEKGL